MGEDIKEDGRPASGQPAGGPTDPSPTVSAEGAHQAQGSDALLRDLRRLVNAGADACITGTNAVPIPLRTIEAICAALERPLDAIKASMAADPEMAWAWHCNIAVPIMDAISVTNAQSDTASAHLMQHLFDYDITTHPHFQGEKSGAQQYAEFRVALDKEEDAEIAARDSGRHSESRDGQAARTEGCQSGLKGIAQ